MQVSSGQLMVPTPVGYLCQEAPDQPFVVTFYQETDPPTAVVTYGDEQVLTFLSPSGSGSKYNGRNVELWEHQGEAAVDWSGTKLTCKKR
jgi:uncharacterized protein